MLILLFLIPIAYAQNYNPENSIDGEYVKEWLVLGPFLSNNLQRDFLADAGGEANIEPKAGDFIITEPGDTLFWKRYKSNQSVVDLLKAVGNFQNVTAYAFCVLKSKVAGKKQILLGSDDGVAVWINGKQAHYNAIARPLYLDNDQFEAHLDKGANRCLVKVSQGTLNWGFAMRVIPSDQNTNVSLKFYLSSKQVNDEIQLSGIRWKYHPGDNPEWANSDFNDSSWEMISPELKSYDIPYTKWQETGWFRLHIALDSALVGKPIGLLIWQAGNSQIYIDGNLRYTFGERGEKNTGIPKTLTFGDNKNHVIAIRYSNTSLKKFHKAGMAAGIYLRLGIHEKLAEERIRYERPLIGYQFFFTAICMAIGLLHLILFIFFPNIKQNLYFALFLFSYAAAIFFDYQQLLSTDMQQTLFSIKMHHAIWPFFLLFQLRFFYSLFYPKLPKHYWQYWIIVVIAISLSIVAIYNPVKSVELIDILVMAVVVEISRIIVVAFIKKREGTWIIALAFLLFLFFFILDYVMDAGISVPFQEMRNPYAFGIIAFFIAMSVYLSRDFARTNKQLALQETEQKLLEAENARQSKELEDARRLQLSMLPKKMPELPNFEISVFMKTATEVGGDYYDFKTTADGTLILAIGDATGHGMQAGTMVSATKSLFHALAEENSPVKFLQKSSEAIKAMGLKNIFMALSLAKFKDNHLQLSSAGMPFTLIYHAATGQVETVKLKGMPLGGFTDFPYKEYQIHLSKGDTLLFRSDGFEEIFNSREEMLSEERLKKLFEETAIQPPAKIIEYLKEAGDNWAEGRDFEDDVTFVVVKIK